MAQKVEQLDAMTQSIQQEVAGLAGNNGLSGEVKVIAGKAISVEFSNKLETLADNLKKIIRDFFVKLAETFGLKVIAIQRHDEGRRISCAFEAG